MRPCPAPLPTDSDRDEQRMLAQHRARRIETHLEVQFRRVENLLRTMDALTRRRGAGR